MKDTTRLSLSLMLVAAAAVSILGALPHIAFSLDVGEIAFFKNAYDEDTYALYPFGIGSIRVDRLLSDVLRSGLILVSGGSIDVAMIALDAILPALALLAAFALATVIFRRNSARLLFALLLVFASDLFTLGSAASLSSHFLTIDALRAVFGSLGMTIVPNIETSYLNILRSPEPQLAYAVGFFVLSVIVTMVKNAHRPIGLFLPGALIVLQVLLMMSYAIVAYPIVAIEAYAGLILLVSGQMRRGAFLAGLAALSAIMVPIASRILTVDGGSFIFASRLPIVTVGVIGSCLLTITVLVLLVKSRFRDRMLWLAGGFAGLPLALTNQQILTGIMVSSRDWERYINTQLLVIAAALVLVHLIKSRRDRPADHGSERQAGDAPAAAPFPPAVVSAAGAVGVALVAIFVVGSGYRGYQFWLSDNLKSVAAARVILAASAKVPGPVTVVLDEPSLAPLINLRLGGRTEFLLDYSKVFLKPVPPLAKQEFHITPVGSDLFEYWRLTGVTPAAARAILNTELASRSGYYTAFFFHVCDYWWPCTDNRAVRSEEIAERLPRIEERFTAYRRAGRTGAPGSPYLYVAVGEGRDPPPAFDARPVAEAAADARRAVAYLQKGRDSNGR